MHTLGIFVLGFSYQTATLALRERWVLPVEETAQFLQQACLATGVQELAVLSTCNRVELYGRGSPAMVEHLLVWWSDYHRLPIQQILPSLYQHWQRDAVDHLSRVACGLDSLVLGEPQILGQMKTAYLHAKEARTLARCLERLFQHVFAVAKHVRTDTRVGRQSMSVAFTAVLLAKRIFTDLAKSRVLLIGAGDTVRLLARHFHDQPVQHIWLANRTRTRAEVLAVPVNAQVIDLEDIPQVLPEADIVISSTASPLPLLGKGLVEKAVKQRKHKPIFMIDLAVPRDIEPEVGTLDDVYLYTVDDLQQLVSDNQQQRREAADVAMRMIGESTERFMQKMREWDAIATIRRYRHKTEQLRQGALEKALRDLEKGVIPEDVLQYFSHALTNKVMHYPSLALRQAAVQGRDDLLAWAHCLFDLDDADPVSERHEGMGQ